MSAEELHELESVACPGAGACGGQFTANTMSTILEFLGISPPGLNGIPALSAEEGRRRRASAAGSSSTSSARDVRPSQIVTLRGARERRRIGRRDRRLDERRAAPARDRPRVRRSPFTIDDFDRIAGRTPVLADMKPWGRFHATDVYRAGGVALVARELAKQGLVHGEMPTVDGRTLGEVGDRGRRDRGPGGRRDDRRRRSRRAARSRILRGNLAPDGCVVKLTVDRTQAPRARPRLRHRAGRVRRGEGQADPAGRRGRDPLRGPGRRPGHAGDAPGDGRDHRRGARRLGRADHRRPLLRRDARVHGRPRRARGRTAAARSPRSRKATRS